MTHPTFDEYQALAATTAIFPRTFVEDENGDLVECNLLYPALGVGGEAGEVCEKVKKLLRDKRGRVDDEVRDAVKKEVGDVLWYLATITRLAELSLGECASANYAKLKSRQDRGKLKGSGDDR